MKKQIYIYCITALLLINACSKEEKSERFRLLTTPVWSAESFDASGTDTTGIGILVKQLKGDAKFKEDGTGSFGNFTGQWKFMSDETQIEILTQLLPPIITDIIQLTTQTLKLSATVTIITHPQDPIDLVMTFKAK